MHLSDVVYFVPFPPKSCIGNSSCAGVGKDLFLMQLYSRRQSSKSGSCTYLKGIKFYKGPQFLSTCPSLPQDLRISSQTWRITIPRELHGTVCFTTVNPAWIAQPVLQKLQTTLLHQTCFYWCSKTQKLKKSLLKRILHTVRCRSAVLQTEDRNVSRRMSKTHPSRALVCFWNFHPYWASPPSKLF